MKTITVVIPALNEEQGIGLVLKEIPISKLMSMGYETEVMVIDNGSKDKTCHIARQHGATVLIQPVRGYGNAYKAGFANASGDIIVTGDADHTYPFEDLPEILAKMEKEGLDFISTNRLKHVNTEVMTPSHIFGNKLLTAITKFLFKFPFVDTQSGMWIFRRAIWDALDVKSSGMAFSQELKIEAYMRGFKCAEVPIKYRIRSGVAKLNTLQDGTKVIFQIFHKRFSTSFLTNTSKGNESASIFEGTSNGPYSHHHIDEKNVFKLSYTEGFAADNLEGERFVQGWQSLQARKVPMEKLYTHTTTKEGEPEEEQTVLEYVKEE